MPYLLFESSFCHSACCRMLAAKPDNPSNALTRLRLKGINPSAAACSEHYVFSCINRRNLARKPVCTGRHTY